MTKTTEISVPVDDGPRYLALRADSEIAEALAANLVAGETIQASDLCRVKTPAGGGKVWQWTDAAGVERSEKAIAGVLVAYIPSGSLWGSEEPAKGELPVLVTYDFVTARRVNDKIGDLDEEQLEACRVGDRLYAWDRLPWTQYGSGKGGFGKRAKESRMLFVLQSGETWPVVVTAGPGSLKTIAPFVKKLPLPHFRCEVELTLAKQESSGGIVYSQIVPRLIGTLSREEGAVIQKLYAVPLQRIAQTFEVDTTDGE